MAEVGIERKRNNGGSGDRKEKETMAEVGIERKKKQWRKLG